MPYRLALRSRTPPSRSPRTARDATCCGETHIARRSKNVMHTAPLLSLSVRRQRALPDAAGHTIWETVAEPRTVSADQTALVLCDVWDHHWCRGAEDRLA